jgi:hypothetical protein
MRRQVIGDCSLHGISELISAFGDVKDAWLEAHDSSQPLGMTKGKPQRDDAARAGAEDGWPDQTQLFDQCRRVTGMAGRIGGPAIAIASTRPASVVCDDRVGTGETLGDTPVDLSVLIGRSNDEDRISLTACLDMETNTAYVDPSHIRLGRTNKDVRIRVA